MEINVRLNSLTTGLKEKKINILCKWKQSNMITLDQSEARI